jgi:hypothetical protein
MWGKALGAAPLGHVRLPTSLGGLALPERPFDWFQSLPWIRSTLIDLSDYLSAQQNLIFIGCCFDNDEAVVSAK